MKEGNENHGNGITSHAEDGPGSSDRVGRPTDEGAETNGSYDLTNSQILLWTGQKLTPDVPLYNMILAFDIDGAIDPEHFNRAFQVLLDRSDALRTVIEESDGTPRARIRPPYPFEPDLIDLSETLDREAALDRWIGERSARILDLSERLFDTVLIKVAERRYVWYINQHHLITDGWSTALVYRYVSDLYTRSLNGSLNESPALPAYAEYAAYERSFHTTPLFYKAKAYWDEKQRETPELIRLYGKKPSNGSHRTSRDTIDLGVERSRMMRDMARREDLRSLTDHQSYFCAFATVLLAYLHRVSGQLNLVIGTPSHNRPTAAFKETVGVFIEVFPFRVEIDQNETFVSLHKKVRGETSSFLRYAQPGTSSAAGNRGYNVLMNYINASFPPFNGAPVRSEWIHTGHGDSNHQLRLQVHDFDDSGQFVLHFDVNSDLFDPHERHAARGHFVRLLEAFLQDPAQPIRQPSLLSDTEKRHLLAGFSRSTDPDPVLLTVLDHFESQVNQTPDAVAVSCGEVDLTYSELNAQANQLASYLRKMGIKSNVSVVVFTRRSIETIVGILGILKTGGAYVPIDSSHPADRISFMIEISRAEFLLTQASLVHKLPSDLATPTFLLDSDWNNITHEPAANAEYRPAGSDLAYVLFTSGSTGKPKGVMVEHHALANYILWARKAYLQEQASDFPLFTSISFDLTVTSLFGALVSGGRIVVYEEPDGAFDTSVLRVFEESKVDVVKLTPSHLALIRDFDLSHSRIQTLILGGEDLKVDLARAITRAFGNRVALYNEYGPTEASVGCMIHRFDPEADTGISVPIGRPAARASIYVLDGSLNPAPPGVAGELFIGGPGLARGYVNRPDLTNERFIEDPFHAGERLYKTGDLGRWRPDGTLEYLGRTDQQVKIRGIRIELAEIEAALSAHPAIEGCVVYAVDLSLHTAETAYCTRCGLPSSYPNVQFDETGVCNLCRGYDAYAEKARGYFKTIEDLQRLFDQARATNRNPYDCLMLLSGGKDSTYALYRLVGMGLHVLTFTLDNGYISDGAKANIRRVTDALGVDHVFGTTSAMNLIFADSLKRHSNVCNGCFKTIYTLGLKLARERKIPFIVTGLSRGQFFETRLTEELFWNDRVDVDHIDHVILEARKAYHRVDDAVAQLLETDRFIDDTIFEEVQFVDFYRYCDVGLDEMLTFLREHAPWIRPHDTGRSTNCLINEAGIYVHKKERGYHNYAFPYSWDVRMGHKTREAAMEELDDEIDERAVHKILSDIGYETTVERLQEPASTLTAYYVASGSVAPSELRAHLSRRLPPAMIPAHFVRMERLPLNVNGKVDAARLPKPDMARLGNDTASYVAPRNEIEARVAGTWAEVLNATRVGVFDSFLDLGGNSLLAIQIISRLNQAFRIDLPLHSAFEADTVEKLGGLIEETLFTEIESLTEEEAERLADSA